MKLNIEVEPKCRNCVNWEFMDTAGDFVEDGKEYCKLDNITRGPSEYCDKIEVDIETINKEMRESLGFGNITITRSFL